MSRNGSARWLAGVALLAGCGNGGDLTVHRPWILMASQDPPMLAGYAVIENGTAAPVTVEEFTSPAFERVSLHRTVIENGQARMHPVDTLTVPAGGRAEMSPGGMHLMLMHPGDSLAPGDRVRIDFRLADGRLLEVEFTISDHHSPDAP